MPDFSIDYPLFRRLLRTSLGIVGDYEIGEEGVRASPEFIGRRNDPLLEKVEQGEIEDFIERSRLVFPASAEKLIAWVEAGGGDFDLPDWFYRVAGLPAEQALEELRLAERTVEGQLEASKDSRAGAGDAYWLDQELQAIRCVRARVSPDPQDGSDVAREGVVQVRPLRREDALATEILSAISVLEQASKAVSVSAVWKVLASFAGKAGSCIVRVEPDAIVWRDSAGVSKNLSRKNLRERMQRMRDAIRRDKAR